MDDIMQHRELIQDTRAAALTLGLVFLTCCALPGRAAKPTRWLGPGDDWGWHERCSRGWS